MSTGLTNRFNILQQSPYDLHPGEPDKPCGEGKVNWLPSRYNIRATAKDGRLVIWNSFSGNMSIFGAAKKDKIEALLSQRGILARQEGIIKYLSDRGFLVKEGTDEYRRIQVGFGQEHFRTDTLQLILLASEDCNLRCTYCYEDFARGTMVPSVRSGVKNLVRSRLKGLRSLSVSWFGGEPLYGFAAIEDLAPYFLEISQENDLHYSSVMTTNGYLLTPKVAEKLLAWRIRAFQITIDGAPEDHDRNRPARNGEGTFATIFENLKALRERSDQFRVDIRVNFDRQNHPRITGFLDLLAEEFQGDSRFGVRFRTVGQWGGPNDAGLDVCGTEESAHVQLEMKTAARRRGLVLSDDIRHVGGLGAQVCYAARPYNFIIGASGKVMKCTIDLDKEDRNVVGRITEDGVLELDRDKMALWTEPAFERDSKCQKCVVLPACQGVFCPLIRIESGESPCSPLRMGAKKELLEAVENCGDASRKVAIRDGIVSREESATPVI
jgi:uncharacterized protein